MKLMVERDKNRFCIVMWSMRNESAYGCNFEKALEWTKKFDQDRITQYESARYRNYDKTYDYSNLGASVRAGVRTEPACPLDEDALGDPGGRVKRI